jgi:N-acetylmuramoyl-L-alanine amidase
MKVVISSGHGYHVRGASGSPVPPQLDEVDFARRVVDRVATILATMHVEVTTLHDNVSTSQSANLDWIVNHHNALTRDWDFSVHMNCYDHTAHGCEVLYVSSKGQTMAKKICDAICAASGLTNRGAKKRTDLKFLNSTEMPSCLLEVAFCDNTSDCQIVETKFEAICWAIAGAVSGEDIADIVPPDPESPEAVALFYAKGRASYFGGPEDSGVSRTEGLAFISSIEQAPHLFLPYQPSGTTGLARRLNPYVHYVACRWDYAKTPKAMLLEKVTLVRALKTSIAMKAFPADWGPNENTGRVADLSPTLMDDLGIQTDDEVEVTIL